MPSDDAPSHASHWTAKIGKRGFAFGLFGILDGALITIGGSGGTSWPLLICLWILLGLLLAFGWGLTVSLALGPNGEDRLIASIRARWQVWVRDQDTPEDTRRLARLIGGMVGVVFFLATAFFILRYLMVHRHGVTLIAATFLVSQIVVLVVALGVGGASARTAGWLLSKRKPLRFPATLKCLFAALLVITIGVIIRFWAVFLAVDGIAISLVLGAIATSAWLARWSPRIVAGTRGALALLLTALVGTFAFAQIESMKQEAVTAYGAKYIRSGLQVLSDFDRDGAPAFPVMLDCAPFDASRHPTAREIPGNGVDENCDGLDKIVGAYTPLRRQAKRAQAMGADLMLITIDTVRADHLGYMGYKRPTSPHLDAFAKRATVFTHAYSQDSGTGPSLWSLMTGKTPFQVKLADAHLFPPQLGADEATLALRLKAKGYVTVAVLCGSVFGKQRPPKRDWNIRRGFDRFFEVCGRRGLRGSHLARGVTQRALKELKALRARGKRFFLWVHYLDPHEPYADHPDLDFGTRPIDRYDEELAYTDRELNPLLALATTGKRPTVIAITADHGENFKEHGNAPHARNLYREVTHVPLILYVSGQPGRRVDAPVAVGDIHPTFLEFAGIPLPKELTMVSQGAVLMGAPPDPERLVFQENSFSRPRRHVKAVVSREHHLIWDTTNNTYELYALRKDPAERENLAGKGASAEERLKAILRHFVSTTRVPKNLAK